MKTYLTKVIKKLEDNEFTQFCLSNKVILALLFGSVSLGTTREGSDIDLALLLEKQFFPRDSLASGRLKRKLVRELSAVLETSKIDLVLLNNASLLLSFQIARTGRLIYQRDPGDYAGYVSLALRRHSDAELFYRLDEEYLSRYIRNI